MYVHEKWLNKIVQPPFIDTYRTHLMEYNPNEIIPPVNSHPLKSLATVH